MNKIKYDAMVPGQHDFLFGYENLLNLSKLAEFPFIASNIKYLNNNKYVFEPYTIVEIDNVKIGIIGIASSNMQNLVLSKNIQGIYFSNEVDALNEWIPKVKNNGADVVIILSSLGIPTLFFGFYPDPLINTIEVSITDLIEMYNYKLVSKF